MLGNVVTYVPPVLVAHVLGAEHSAYFYVPDNFADDVDNVMQRLAEEYGFEAEVL